MSVHGEGTEDCKVGHSTVNGAHLPCVAPGPSAAARLTVVVGDTRFSEERALLAQSCGYFRALYRSGMRDSRQDVIHLGCLRARGFLIAVTVLRGGRPLLDADEIVEAIECAAYLQAVPLTRHLTDLINSDSCLLICHTSATYGLTELYVASALFIRDMYCDLRAEVRDALPPELASHVESLAPSSFVAVGAHAACGAGDVVHAASRTVCYLDEGANAWRVLTDLPPEASTSMAGVAVLDNKLYVVGGVRGPQRQAVESCFCYSPDANEWSGIDSPAQPRYNFALRGVSGRLYAIGGEHERMAISSVEVYDARGGGAWTHAAHLPRPAAGAACATAMSRLFACLWKPADTTEVYEYLPGADEWARVTALVRQQSYGHCMVGHRDNLYVVRNGRGDDFLRCPIDCYNLTVGQWTALPGHFANSRGALFTSVVRGDSVLTLNRSMTLEYVVEGKTWKPRAKMKGFPRSGSVWTFLLRLPNAIKQT